MKEEEDKEDDAIGMETASKSQPGILPAQTCIFIYIYIVSSRKPAAIITVRLTCWREAEPDGAEINVC